MTIFKAKDLYFPETSILSIEVKFSERTDVFTASMFIKARNEGNSRIVPYEFNDYKICNAFLKKVAENTGGRAIVDIDQLYSDTVLGNT